MFAFLQRNRAVILTATAATVVAGGLSLPRLGSGIYPEVEFPRISVVVRGGDEPPEVFQATAVRPVEETLATVLGVRRLRTRVVRGAAQVALLFAPSADMMQALQAVNSRLAEARQELPEGTDLEAELVTPAEFPILAFNLVGGPDGAARREAAERVVRPTLSRAEGVARIQLLGGDEREIAVIADPERLAAARLRPSELATRLSDQLVRAAVGRVDSVRQTSAVVVEAKERAAESLAALAIAGPGGSLLSVGQLATVTDGAADRRQIVRAPEGDAVFVAVSRLPGASTPEVARAVLLEREALRLPAGMRLVKVYDQGELVSEAIRGIRDAILIGILLTASVLALFLRDLRSGLLAALSLPLTLVATFAVMQYTGQTLNLMSLGGLAISIGLVIDDAVVVVEAFMAQRERGVPLSWALTAGLESVAAPVLGTTLTTVVVFLPLAFLEGIVGSFFAALAVTLSAAVLISLAYALGVLPVMASGWLRAEAGPGPRAPRFRRLRGRYAALLRRSLRRRRALLAAGAVAVAAGLACLGVVPTGFLPEFDEGAFVIDYFLPAGTSLADTDRAARGIEAVLDAMPEVATWSRRTGAELGPVTATTSDSGDFTVLLRPRAQRRDGEEVIAELRGRLAAAVPAARLEFIQLIEDVLSDLSGAPRPIEVRISGDDPRDLKRAAHELAREASAVPGLVDYYSGVEGSVPTVRLWPDATALTRLGRTRSDLADDLGTALRGKVVGTVPWLDRLIPVRVRYPDSVRFAPDQLHRLPVLAADGGVLPLGMVARISEDPEPSVLFRENLRPVVIASADIEGGDLGAVTRELERRMEKVKPPSGGRLEIGGRAESQRQAFRDLARVFLLGLLAVLAVLVAQFRALKPALLVLATIPPALAGAFLLLASCRVPLNASSLIGVVLLTGLVVKNGILLLERAQRNRAAGMPPRVALVEAAHGRVRPIVMTTLCTIAGLLPLAFGLGTAGEMQRPLALAVIGGLFVSTATTLFLLPALAAEPAVRASRPPTPRTPPAGGPRSRRA